MSYTSHTSISAPTQEWLSDLQQRYRDYREQYAASLAEAPVPGAEPFRPAVPLLRVPVFGIDGTPLDLFRTFLLTADLLASIEALARTKALSWNDIVELGRGNATGAPVAAFTPDALNAWNACYYTTPWAFDDATSLSRFFACGAYVNQAFGKLIAGLLPGRPILRIIEAACGRRIEAWPHIAEGLSDRTVDLTLSDMKEPIAPADMRTALAEKNVQLRTAVHDLRHPLAPLAADGRYDAVVATYAFDSIWMPQDAFYHRINGQWFRHTLRLKVSDASPRRDVIMAALRGFGRTITLEPVDFLDITAEEDIEPADLNAHPYGDDIVRLYGNATDGSCECPGGLIDWIQQTAETCLRPSGVIVIGDIVTNSWRLRSCAHTKSGIGAAFKIQDYTLVREALRARGYEAEIIPVGKLEEMFLTPDSPRSWDQSWTEREQSAGVCTCVLCIKKLR